MAFGRQSLNWSQLNILPWVGWGHGAQLDAFDSGWHAHDTHQLLYANEGVLRVDVEGAMWRLPPGRGAWIRGRVSHRVITTRATLRTIYMHPAAVGIAEPVRIFSVDAHARQMLIHAQSWSQEQREDPLARLYFQTVMALFEAQWSHKQWAFDLPTTEDALLQRAIDYAHANLAEASLDGAARAAFTSTRTLSRRFQAQLSITWRAYLSQARLIRAMDLLVAGMPVTDVAFEVGFESPSAFTKAFKQLTGQLPSQLLER